MNNGLRRLDIEIKKLRETLAKLHNPGFSYPEQELIRRVFKSILPQLKNATDKGIATDILEKTDWLEKINGE